MTLPETLLAYSSFINVPMALTFFDPFLYGQIIHLQISKPEMLAGKDVVKKVWSGDLYWDADTGAFSYGGSRVANSIRIMVSAEYRRNVLKSYRVQISGLPDLFFSRNLYEEDKLVKSPLKVKLNEQPARGSCFQSGRGSFQTGQFDSGYSSFGSGWSLLNTNAMKMPTPTTGLHIRLKQKLMLSMGCFP